MDIIHSLICWRIYNLFVSKLNVICNSVCVTDNGGKHITHSSASRVAQPNPHVFALLFVFIRVQVVQHGLGTPPKAHVHREQLAVLHRVWPPSGSAHWLAKQLHNQVGMLH